MPICHDHLFKALSDRTRRGLFEQLCSHGEQTVASLTRSSAVSQPAVSKHLAALAAAGLVKNRPQGRETFYTAQPGALVPLLEWTQTMARFWDARFDKLDDLLRRMDQ